jgi:hypothetical protein
MEDAVYTLTAKRDAAGSGALTLQYEDKEFALAAAAVLKEYCPVVFITSPDGSKVDV